MRELSELRVNERGRPVNRKAPSTSVIEAFQLRFDVQLPDNYLAFLRYANGGHPELDLFVPINTPAGEGEWAVNRFHHLDDDTRSTNSLWWATETWRPILGEDALPFAGDGVGNEFFLDLTTTPPAVKLCIHDDEFRIVNLASSFEAFIDGLTLDPDAI